MYCPCKKNEGRIEFLSLSLLLGIVAAIFSRGVAWIEK
jgi:hypothetical protein